jgi:hypothetical protein
MSASPVAGVGVPTPDQMEDAAAWLDYREGDDSAGCMVVAAWLRKQAEEKFLRDTARAHNVPVKKLRARLAAREGAQS